MQKGNLPARKRTTFAFKLVLSCLVCVLLVAVFTGLTVMTHTVTIHDGDRVYELTTTETDPAQILAGEGVQLNARDHFEFTEIKDRKADLYVIRSLEVQFTENGESEKVVVTTGTVQDLLDLMEVTPGKDDVLNCKPEDQLQDGQEVTLTRISYEQYEEEQVIPFEKDKPEEELEPGATLEVETAGKDGKKLTTYRKTIVNGEVVGTEVVSDVVTTEPVTEVYSIKEPPVKTPDSIKSDESYEAGRNVQGSGSTTEVYVGNEIRYYEPGTAPVELDENGIPLNYIYKVSGVASAYSNFGRPTLLAPGCVAMNQSIFPFATRVYIRSTDGSYVYGYSKVADDGKAVNEGRVLVDCFFNTYEESAEFGLKDVDIYVLSYPEEGEE